MFKTGLSKVEKNNEFCVYVVTLVSKHYSQYIIRETPW